MEKKYPNDKNMSDLKKQFEKVVPLETFSDVIPLDFSALMNMTPAPLEYIISPILPTQGICIIYAGQGVGKTLFSLNLAYGISGGKSFTKYTFPKPRKVLYVDGEMSFTNIHKRITDISKTQGFLANDGNFSLITPDMVLPSRVPKIDTASGQEYYTELMKINNYEVVFFDNLSMLSSIDENKSHEWKIIQDWFLYLRSIGKTIFLIHHAGKDKLGYRGTSRMIDCVNTAISLQTIDEDSPNDQQIECKRIKVSYQKSRDFGGKDALSFEINLLDNKWNYQSIELTEMEKVIESTKAGMSQREIAKEMLCSQKKINNLLKKAKRDGRFLV